MRMQVQDLIKFVALNYLAVVKAIKKRNRHLQVSQRSLARMHLDRLLRQAGAEHAVSRCIGQLYFMHTTQGTTSQSICAHCNTARMHVYLDLVPRTSLE